MSMWASCSFRFVLVNKNLYYRSPFMSAYYGEGIVEYVLQSLHGLFWFKGGKQTTYADTSNHSEAASINEFY